MSLHTSMRTKLIFSGAVSLSLRVYHKIFSESSSRQPSARCYRIKSFWPGGRPEKRCILNKKKMHSQSSYIYINTICLCFPFSLEWCHAAFWGFGPKYLFSEHLSKWFHLSQVSFPLLTAAGIMELDK